MKLSIACAYALSASLLPLVALSCNRSPAEGTPPSGTSVITTGASAGLPPLTYAHYTSQRLHYSVDYPEFFEVKPSAEGAEGQEWVWGTRAKMTAWGRYNGQAQTFDEFCKTSASRAGVSQKNLTPSSCFVAGSAGGKLFWQKALLEGDVLYGVNLEYDEGMKAYFEPLVEHVDKTLKKGP